ADTRAAPTARQSARRVATRRLPPARPSWRATTSALGAVAWGSPGIQGGGGLRVTVDTARGYGWALDLLGLRREDDVPLGTVSVSSLAGGLAAHAWRSLGALRGRAAIGARLGAAILTGEASSPDVRAGQVSGLSGGPFARVSADCD